MYLQLQLQHYLVKAISIAISLCSILLLCVSVAHAAQERVSVGVADTTVPAAPDTITIVNQSREAITIEWTPAVDDQAVWRYIVYRDGEVLDYVYDVTVITDTEPIGNAVYEVYAQDYGNNVSAVPASVIVQFSSSGGGSRSSREETSFSVQEFVTPAGLLLAITTPDPSQVTVRYGLTPALELGTISRTVFATNSEIVLPNIAHDTQVYYQVSFTTRSGTTDDLQQMVDMSALPAQVLHTPPTFTWGDLVSGQIQLLVNANVNTSVQTLTIVFNPYSVPNSPVDGDLLYEGVVQTTAIANRPGYYALFVTDQAGVLLSTSVLTRDISLQTDLEDSNVLGIGTSVFLELFQRGSLLSSIDPIATAGLPLFVRWGGAVASRETIGVQLLSLDGSYQSPMYVLQSTNTDIWEAAIPLIPDQQGMYRVVIYTFDQSGITKTSETVLRVKPFEPDRVSIMNQLITVLQKLISVMQLKLSLTN